MPHVRKYASRVICYFFETFFDKLWQLNKRAFVLFFNEMWKTNNQFLLHIYMYM